MAARDLIFEQEECDCGRIKRWSADWCDVCQMMVDDFSELEDRCDYPCADWMLGRPCPCRDETDSAP